MKIAVIGAGTMGPGIAQCFASREEYEVVLCSSSLSSAERGKEKLMKQIMRRVEKGSMSSETANAILERIKIGDIADCSNCDLVIECIPEIMQNKKELWNKLQEICKPECIFATNTSSLSITEMGRGLRNPLIGMHFFNPAPTMKLVEVIPGLNTADEVVAKVVEVAKSIDKVPIEVPEHAGFIVNRLLIPMINEAVGLYAEGISTAEEIDMAMKLGANHPMGPLALGDFIGLDVCLAIMEVIFQESGDPKYRPHPMLRKMVRGGRLGKKTRIGFYKY